MPTDKRNNKDNSLLIMIIILILVIVVCAEIVFAVMHFTGNKKNLAIPTPMTTYAQMPTQTIAPTQIPTQSPTPAPMSSPFTRAVASDVRESYKSISYGAENVLDGKSDTAWTPNANAYEPWICLLSNSDQTVNGFYIQNGYFKSEELYYENMRVKDIEVSCSGEYFYFTLNDLGFGKLQNVKFPYPIKTNSIKITVLSTYSGSKYDELCISEINPY